MKSGHSIESQQFVWMFGTGRSGSTWLAAMMDDMRGYVVWKEPLIGALFGNLYYGRAGHLQNKPGRHFILGNAYRQSWTKSIREFVISEAATRFPRLGEGHLVIKEPNGALGAPLVMDAFSEGALIFLIRDPRDVVASSMDARRSGGWHHESRGGGRESQVDKDPDAFVRTRARAYTEQIGKVREAYQNHTGRKVLVRYEDLVRDTLPTMQRIYDTLQLPYRERSLAKVVEKHSWSNIPEEQKGDGKFYRKGRSGGWKEDLTDRQVKIVEKLTGDLLEEYYPHSV